MKRLILIFALLTIPADAAPKFDAGRWAQAHWTSAAFDYSTTGYVVRECLSRYPAQYCGEENPVARAFIGRYPQPWKLSLGFAAESAIVSLIPNRKVRRIVQIAAIGGHIFFGARNL